MTTDIFFQIVTPDEALARLFDHLPTEPRRERIALHAAPGRITAEPLISPEDSPAFARSAMDGYAVRAADTYGASEALPAFLTVDGEVPMGAAAERPLQPGTAQLIHTGGMLPPQADAVVMVEHTQPVDDTSVEVLRPAAPGQHVIQAGEDLAAGDTLLPAGHQLRAQDLGVLAALGITEVDAALRPVVGVLSSGDEIVSVDATPAPGQVRDVNATTLTALARQAGADVRDFGVAPDVRAELERRTRQALDTCDLVVISAGSSVSTRDMTADVIAGLGQPGVLAHGIAMSNPASPPSSPWLAANRSSVCRATRCPPWSYSGWWSRRPFGNCWARPRPTIHRAVGRDWHAASPRRRGVSTSFPLHCNSATASGGPLRYSDPPT